MFKFLVKFSGLVLLIYLTGCTQAQRFALKKNAELDQCAMKRMLETKISGQQGYLQAFGECHKIVNLQKFSAMNISRRPECGYTGKSDEMWARESCLDYAKGLYIDAHYPELRLNQDKLDDLTRNEAHRKIVSRNANIKELSGDIKDIDTDKLLEIRELMATSSVIDHKTLCAPWTYQEVEAIIGQELRRRNPGGVSASIKYRGGL